MQVAVYAIGDLAIETALNLLDHFNVIKIIDMELAVVKSRGWVIRTLVKLNIFTYTQLVFLDFNIPMINRRMDKGILSIIRL